MKNNNNIKDIVVLIFAVLVSVVILIPVVSSNVHNTALRPETIDWIAKILMTMLGAVVMYIGLNSNNNKSE